MRNLAGKHSNEKDYAIELELRCAGIDPVIADEPNGREVNTRITGRIGNVTLERAWYYWVVRGLVPIEMAEELFATTTGQDCRIDGYGHPGDRSPVEGCATYAMSDGGIRRCVDLYHIDTQEALDLFAEKARDYALDRYPLESLGWTVEATNSLVAEMTDAMVQSPVGKIFAAGSGSVLGDVNMNDPRIIDIVRRCREAHPGVA